VKLIAAEFEAKDPEATLHAMATEILNYRQDASFHPSGAPVMVPPVLSG